MRFNVVILLFILGVASAQSLTVGVKGGVPVNGDISGDATSESKRYVVGPMVTVALPRAFSMEADVLYRRAGYRSSNSDILGGSYFLRGTANSWEFPIIIRRRVLSALYAGVGYDPRVLRGSARVNAINVVDLSGRKTYSTYTLPTNYKTTHGLVVTGGIEKRFGSLLFAPEVRYIHWSGHALSVAGSHGFGYESRQEQWDIMLGISFR